ncbi:MAG: PP2C family protein-serine/threonine phosphatase [Phycisphaerae bacterium]
MVRSRGCDAVLLAEPDDRAGAADRAAFRKLLHEAETRHIATLMIARRGQAAHGKRDSLIDVIDPEVTAAELRGRLATIARYHGMLTRLEAELGHMERLSRQLSQHSIEVDQELKLACRLQRDFLPQVDEPIDGVRFATVYRPASWVSGDIYDIFRIDQHHIGVYVADAVGHGMAAGLLTMFIKRSVAPRRATGDRCSLLDPSEVMRGLNDALTEQALPNCQFVTACYGVLNTRTLGFRYARGGHPYPLRIDGTGRVSELRTSGGLLGLFPNETFPTVETTLEPGEKVLLYTDGVEVGIASQDHRAGDGFLRAVEAAGTRPIQDMLDQVTRCLDSEPGSLRPHDDVSIVGFELPSEPGR